MYVHLLTKIIYAYLCISFVEWFIHRYIMHGDATFLKIIPFVGDCLKNISDHHHEHHSNIMMNMEVNPINETDHFVWYEAIFFSIVYFILMIPIFQNNYLLNLIISSTVSLIYTFIWNNIHNDMHNSTGNVSIYEGPPNFLKKKLTHNPLYSYLWYHHAIHHLHKSPKHNFNIICIGFDHIMGTTKNNFCYDNTLYCSENQLDKKTCSKPKGTHCLHENNIHR